VTNDRTRTSEDTPRQHKGKRAMDTRRPQREPMAIPAALFKPELARVREDVRCSRERGYRDDDRCPR